MSSFAIRISIHLELELKSERRNGLLGLQTQANIEEEKQSNPLSIYYHFRQALRCQETLTDMFLDYLRVILDRCHSPVNKKGMAALLVTIFALSSIAVQLALIVYGSNEIASSIATTPVSAVSPSWNVQEVLTDGSFGTICMVLDSNNNPHIVHAGKNGIMYYTMWDGADWRTQSIIQGGTPYALVLDRNNIPHILYKGANGVTYYASLSGDLWKFQTVPSGNRYSLALDKQGNPHLAYGTQLLVSQYPPGITNNYYALNYASWNGTGWATQVIVQQMSSSDTISLVLDSQSKPHIMYGNDTYYPPSGGYTITVKIATWTGSNWSIQTGPSELDYIGKMVLDSSDYPHFTYERNYPHESIGNVSLGYASWDGATWSLQTVAANNYLPGLSLQSDLALDSRGNPHIEFFNSSLLYASWTGPEWKVETVAPDQFAYGEGPLALDSYDKPNICYWVNDIRNTTAFVSMLIISTPTPLYRQGPLPRPTSAPTPTPPASASLLWIHPSNWSIVNSPVLSNGLIYVSSGNSGTGTLGLLCLNASTGAETWNHIGLFSTFSIANGCVYVGEASYGSNFTLGGLVSCLNASIGAPIWNYSEGTSFTSPLVNEDMVYAAGFSYSLSTNVNAGFIYAFNASTGQRLWSFQCPTGTRFDHKPLSLEGTYLYAMSAAYSSQDASWHGAIYALDAQSGKLLWNYTTFGQFGSFLTDGRNVYVSSNSVDTRNNLDAQNSGGSVYEGGIACLDGVSGKMLWNYPIDDSVGQPVAVDDTLYVASGNGVLYSFNASNGKALWSYTAGTGIGSIHAVDGYLYVGSSTGVLCLNRFNGAVIWNFAASDFTGSSPCYPTYADGIVYVGANGPMFFSPVTHWNFYAVDASTGERLWNYTLGYGVASEPTFEKGVVYIGGDFVTGRSPDLESAGAVIALKPSIASLPLRSPVPNPSPSPSPTVSEFWAWIILPLAVITTFAALLYVRRRKQSTKNH